MNSSAVDGNVGTIDKSNVNEKGKVGTLQAGFLFAGVALMSAGAGFGATLGAVRRREKDIVSSAGFEGEKAVDFLTHEAGTRLALRALGWGTVLAVTGVSILVFSVWKISGAHNFQEFRMKMGSILPVIPKTSRPGRSEFESLEDFLDHVSKGSKDS